MHVELAERKAAPAAWTRPHLLGLEDLSREEILTILDTAEDYVELSQRRRKKRATLTGKVMVNLFFEPSTRTRTSFSLAARRLSADTLDFTPGGSSLSKGETFIDTAKNIQAMGVDVMVVRHSSPGAPHLLAKHLQCSIINAGDGAHEHPTQGLLDMFTIRQLKGRLDNLTVGLVGDIAHSRVARSNIHGLTKLGARVIVCGPSTLVPRGIERLGVEVAHRLFDMHSERLRRARPDVLLLAPGPINRGVELTPEVADGPHSAILQQVTNGLAVRMAVLYLLCGQPTGE